MTKADWVKYIFRVSRKKLQGQITKAPKGDCRYIIPVTGLTGRHFHFETGSSNAAQATLELMSLSSRSSGVLGSQALPQPWLMLHTTYTTRVWRSTGVARLTTVLATHYIHFTRVWRSTGVARLATALATYYIHFTRVFAVLCVELRALPHAQQMFLCPLMTSPGDSSQGFYLWATWHPTPPQCTDRDLRS